MLCFVDIHCPYCGEPLEIAVDASAGAQQYYEDCQVCCRPILLDVQVDEDGAPQVHARSQDDA